MEEIKDPWESSEECDRIFSDFVFRPSKTPIMESFNEDTKISKDTKYKEESEKSLESYFSKKQIYERFIGEHVVHKLRYLNRCIKLEPTNPFFYRNRAEYFYSTHQADNFYKDNLKVIEYSNDNLEISMALDLYSGYDFAKIGFEFYQSKEYEKSIKFYKIALVINSTEANNHSTHDLNEKYENCIDVNQIVLSSKNIDNYLSMISNAEYSLKRFEDALITLNKAIVLNLPNQSDHILRAGIINLELEKYNDALKLLKQVNKLRPNYSNVFYYLGIAEEGLGNIDNAKSYLEKCINSNPNHEHARILYIKLLENFNA